MRQDPYAPPALTQRIDQLLYDPLPDLSAPAAPAFAFAKFSMGLGRKVRLGRAMAALPLDAFDWPLGRPARTHGQRVADLRRGDHIVATMGTGSLTRMLLTPRFGTRAGFNISMMEPRVFMARSYPWLRVLGRRLAGIISHDEEELGGLKNFIFTPCLASWIRQPEGRRYEKTANLSLIASPKTLMAGHALRHRVVSALRAAKVPFDALGKAYQPLKDKADGHGPYRFSIVIENSQQKHYVTEKLVDAMTCLSVPIYWGAPNVGDYVDPRSLLVARNEQELVAIAARADAALYAQMLPFVKAQQARMFACRRNNAIRTYAAYLYHYPKGH